MEGMGIRINTLFPFFPFWRFNVADLFFDRILWNSFLSIMEINKDKIVAVVKKVVTNKYLLTCIVAVLWFLLFDSHTLVDYYQLSITQNRIEREIAYYKELSIDSQEKMHQLESDMSSLEKFAREQFLMKRADEEIFLFEE